MWIKSKFKNNERMINLGVCLSIKKNTFEHNDVPLLPFMKRETIEHINICFDDSVYWCYDSKEERDKEYDFILSQLDCRVNDVQKVSQKDERVRILRTQHDSGVITSDQWIDELIKIIEE